MPTLVATAGSATANSYITVAAATTYFDERTNVANWTAADGDDQARALISATRRLDVEAYKGDKATQGQALEWPRIGATNRDGYDYDTATIPTFLEQATSELALRVLNDDANSTDSFADTGLEEFNSAAVGPLNVERNASFRAAQLPETVHRLIRHVSNSGGVSRPLSRA